MAVDKELLGEELDRAVELLVERFTARSVRYALVGGLATLLRGRPRFTQDVDFLLDVPQLVLPGLLEDLSAAGFTLDVPTVVRQYVREYMTSFRYGAVRIDWLKPPIPLYAHALAAATPLEWSEGRPIRVATAEGLILTKMVAFRPQDQVDIETLLTANRHAIDLELIRREWAAVAADEAVRTPWLEDAIRRCVVEAR